MLFSGENTPRMPVLFVGHGSPMNAIEENEFVQGWRNLGKNFAPPESNSLRLGTLGNARNICDRYAKPKTIHDFGGFPKALYEVEYPAPGSPDLAAKPSAPLPKLRSDLTKNGDWITGHGVSSVGFIRKLMFRLFK